jgi:hypothetical protein
VTLGSHELVHFSETSSKRLSLAQVAFDRMEGQKSRNIGRFLKPFLDAEGLTCSDYPSIHFSRYTVDGSRDFVWSMQQLADCYAIAAAVQVELVDVTDRDDPQTEIHYASIVVEKTSKGWSDPIVVSDTEDVWLGYDLGELMEKFRRFAEKASRAIVGFLE